jgi:hypothetical protein
MINTTYKVGDEVIVASSPLEFLRKMRDGSRFESDLSLEDYMLAAAEREELFSGRKPDTSSVEAFAAFYRQPTAP